MTAPPGAGLLAEHYPVTEFVLTALTKENAGGLLVLHAVWREVLASTGARSPGVRAAVLGRLVTVLAERRLLADTAAAPLADRFLPAVDRWAGWWAADPVRLTEDALTRSSVLASIRLLPLEIRTLLLLRDAACLTPEEVEPILGATPAHQDALLHDARQQWVDVLDDVGAST